MIGAFILCGGNSRRMGEFKPLVLWNGRSLIDYTIDTVLRLDLPIHLVAKPHQVTLLSNLNLPILKDTEEMVHPLSGVVTALKHLPSLNVESALILPCDSPLITAETLMKMTSHCPSVLADDTGVTHPLISHVSTNQLSSAQTALNNHSSMRAFAESFVRVRVSKEETVNFNHLADLLSF